MLSVYGMIQDALILTGALGVSDGDDLQENIGSLALRTLNGMLANWSTKDLVNYSQAVVTLNPPAQGTTYLTLGTDGIITPDSATRFIQIREIHIKQGTSVWTVPSGTYEEYDRCFAKLTQGIPQIFAYDYQFPVGKLYMWPVPLAGSTVDVIGIKSLAYATSVQGTLDLPDWWRDAIVYNLAVRLGPFIGNPPDEQIMQTAGHALSGIKSMNNRMRTPKLTTDFGSPSAGSWQTWPGRVV